MKCPCCGEELETYTYTGGHLDCEEFERCPNGCSFIESEDNELIPEALVLRLAERKRVAERKKNKNDS